MKNVTQENNEYGLSMLDVSTVQDKKDNISIDTLVIMQKNLEHAKQILTKLETILKQMNIEYESITFYCGSQVIRYEITLRFDMVCDIVCEQADDIKFRLGIAQIRMECSKLDRRTIWIEVPNAELESVSLQEYLLSKEFETSSGTVLGGKGLDGKMAVLDLEKMGAVLVIGTSENEMLQFLNTTILSLLYKNSPSNLSLVLIDTKNKLGRFGEVPHLHTPLISIPKNAKIMLRKLCEEKSNRHVLFNKLGVKTIDEYNKKISGSDGGTKGAQYPELPKIVVIIDELADLMRCSDWDAESDIRRLSGWPKELGIYLIVATSVPLRQVITPNIRICIPARMIFSVKSDSDSKEILGLTEAQILLGNGDALFQMDKTSNSMRLQMPTVATDEIEHLVNFIWSQHIEEELISFTRVLK